MYYRPSIGALLDAVADHLERDILPALPPELQHQVRVAVHLNRMAVREGELQPAHAAAERELLAELLDADPATAVEALNTRLAERIRGGVDDVFAAAAREVLLTVTRRDLDVVKPGYADWTGA